MGRPGDPILRVDLIREGRKGGNLASERGIVAVTTLARLADSGSFSSWIP